MQKAFIVGILVAAIISCIGVIVVLRRLSLIGDALSHSSLAGVAAGMICGINPVFTAIIAAVISGIGIEMVRSKLNRYAEISISIIMSTGIGLAAILSGFVTNTSSFNSFLFGSIVAITDGELWTVIVLSLIVLLTVIFLYKELFFITFDESMARLAGVPVSKINIPFTILTAVTVAISARTVGALIVSSMLVLPVATSMQISKSYNKLVINSVIISVAETAVGLIISSSYSHLKPGGTIVLLSVVVFIAVMLLKRIVPRKYNHQHE